MTEQIYFVKGGLHGGGEIKVVNANGLNETTLVGASDLAEPDGLEVDISGGKMYWTCMGVGGSADQSVAVDDGSIMRANLDGSDIETLVPTGVTSTPKQIALDVAGGKMYWCDRGDVGDKVVNPKVMRANIDGSKIETLITTDLINPVGIALDGANGKMYFTDRYANNIKRANLDGSEVEILVKDTDYPVDLVIDFHKRDIYWTARKAGAIYRTSIDQKVIDGKSLTPLVTGLNAPIGISLDRQRGKMYYADPDVPNKSGAIWVANLDGSNAKKILTTSLPLGLYYVEGE